MKNVHIVFQLQLKNSNFIHEDLFFCDKVYSLYYEITTSLRCLPLVKGSELKASFFHF